MKEWDGFVRQDHGIVFDGQKFYDLPPPEGGYGPYKKWVGGKSVQIITRSQWELRDNKSFWLQRQADQLQYLRDLADRQFTWSGRMQQLLESAIDILYVIEKNIK